MADVPIYFKDRLSKAKHEVKILILGDYSTKTAFHGPDNFCEMKLKTLQTHLKENGFNKTHIVKDFIDEDEIPPEAYDAHFLEKSRHYIIYWADILLFIFLEEGDNQSVVREWGIMTESCPDKCKDSIMLNHEEVILRALIRGDISGKQISHDTFTNDETLHTGATALCFIKLFNFI